MRNLLEISSLLSSFISWPNAHRGSEIDAMDNLVKPKTVVIVAQKAYCIAIEMLGHGQIWNLVACTVFSLEHMSIYISWNFVHRWASGIESLPT